jgi:predicted GNAT family acetyltransferase
MVHIAQSGRLPVESAGTKLGGDDLASNTMAAGWPAGEDRPVINRIRRRTLDNLPDCLALAEDREWLPEEHKWRLLFDVGAVYGLRDEAGDLVGTATLTRYGTQLAAISMVLVAARYGGRGLDRQLMQRRRLTWAHA